MVRGGFFVLMILLSSSGQINDKVKRNDDDVDVDDDDDDDSHGAGEDERVEQLFTNPSKATIRRMLACRDDDDDYDQNNFDGARVVILRMRPMLSTLLNVKMKMVRNLGMNSKAKLF